jgi:predicted NBD/HSP70 family sugar kinase
VADGPHFGCENQGCLEALASGPAIIAERVRILRTGLAPQLHGRVAGPCDRVTPRETPSAADVRDELVRNELPRATTSIDIATAKLVTVLHPDLIMLGSVAELGDFVTSTFRDVIYDQVEMFPTDAMQVIRS